eukprot:TRINITY_DN5845_c0_g1_i2.p1 TRINITY_DN5845_c0_g1~~TRINITY_DN5845_c0_g1_i2.p1  ORF type:complete len:1212 (+),score=241.95 TRINITY_DN5845_c0_g1_i2:256-3636(+)
MEAYVNETLARLQELQEDITGLRATVGEKKAKKRHTIDRGKSRPLLFKQTPNSPTKERAKARQSSSPPSEDKVLKAPSHESKIKSCRSDRERSGSKRSVSEVVDKDRCLTPTTSKREKRMSFFDSDLRKGLAEALQRHKDGQSEDDAESRAKEIDDMTVVFLDRKPSFKRNSAEKVSVGAISKSDSVSKVESDQAKQALLVKELLSTEKNYVKTLESLIGEGGLYQKLLSHAQTVNAPVTGIEQIFHPLEAILDFERKFSVDLAAVVDDWKAKKGVGDLFQRYAPQFPVYTAFAIKKSDNEEAISSLIANEKSPFFEKFSREITPEGMPFIQSLNNAYITPIQRLPRIVMMLSDILRLEKETNEHESLSQAVSQLSAVVHNINEEVAQQQIAVIANKFKNDKHTRALFYTDIGEPRRLQNFLNVQTIYEISGNKVVKQVSDSPLLVFDTFVIASSLPGGRGFIPYPLLWIELTVTPEQLESYKIVYEPVEELFFFFIIGPQQRWLVKHPRDQFVAFAKQIMNLMIKTGDEKEMAYGLRSGAFEYHGIGRYKGGWKSGHPHDQGVFHRDDGVYFKGIWDSSPPTRVGYGTMTQGNGNDIVTAWFNELNVKKGDKRGVYGCHENEKTKHLMKWSYESDLTEYDWNLFLVGSTIVKFEVGEDLYGPETNSYLMKIRSGCVKLLGTKQGEDGTTEDISLSYCYAGNLIGLAEMLSSDSTRKGLKAVALTPVEVYPVEISVLERLFAIDSSQKFRFWSDIERILCTRVADFVDQKQDPSTRVYEIKAQHFDRVEKESREKFYQEEGSEWKKSAKKFNLSKSESLFHLIRGAVYLNDMRGDLGIFTQHMCFLPLHHSTTKKIKFAYPKITNLVLNLADNTLTMKYKNGKPFTMIFENPLQAEKTYNICNSFKTIATKEKPAIYMLEHQFAISYKDWLNERKNSVIAGIALTEFNSASARFVPTDSGASTNSGGRGLSFRSDRKASQPNFMNRLQVINIPTNANEMRLTDLLENYGEVRSYKKGETIIDEGDVSQWAVYSKNNIGIYKSCRKVGEFGDYPLYVFQVLDNSKVIEPFSIIAEEDATVRLVPRAQLKILAISKGFDFATDVYLRMSKLFYSMTKKSVQDRKKDVA